MSLLSLWEQETYYTRSDVTIIGGGLMGLWTAIELKLQAPSLSVTILERNSTPLGASTRNAGFACFGSLTELLFDESKMGTDEMLRIVEMRYKGIQKIKAFLSEEAIALDPCGGYEPLKNYAGADLLNSQIHYLNGLLKPITGTDQSFINATDKLRNIGLKNFDQLVYNPLEAGIHSGKLVNGLTAIALSKGVKILNGIAVSGYMETGNGIELMTNQSVMLKTNKLVVCTNGFTASLLPQLNIEPARGQIVLTAPITGLKTRGTFHFDEGFYYWRNIGNQILLGGARNSHFAEERTTSLEGSDAIRNILSDFLHRHLDTDQPIQIVQNWSGIMGFTPDKHPLCQAVSDNAVAAIACNGMGVALTPVIAETVTNMLLR
ncbi:MAG: FAD-dependent oxidoreductase [Sediminibacterium sp.]|nr:FAD-dependent oxidoreductase [Sediminibacterium sp.]